MPIYDYAENFPLPALPDPRLGARIEFDARSAEYPISALLAPVQLLPVVKDWPLTVWLDQDGIGACVGFSCAGDENAEPIPIPGVTNDEGFSIYREAQKDDPWPGEDYEGTSLLAGIKQLVKRGHVVEYRWAFSLSDLELAVGHIGPAIIATNWYSGMYTPDASGFIRPSGSVVGRHAYLIKGVDPPRQRYRMRNSWSRGWGDDGEAWISYQDMERLRTDGGGEFCIPLKRANPFDVPEPEPPLPEPEPVKPYFSTIGSAIFHDRHRTTGTVDRYYATVQEARDAGKRPCRVCKPR